LGGVYPFRVSHHPA